MKDEKVEMHKELQSESMSIAYIRKRLKNIQQLSKGQNLFQSSITKNNRAERVNLSRERQNYSAENDGMTTSRGMAD